MSKTFKDLENKIKGNSVDLVIIDELEDKFYPGGYTDEQVEILNEERNKELQMEASNKRMNEIISKAIANDNGTNIGRTMEYTIEDEVSVQKEAAKQLLMELMMLKHKAYGKGTLVSSVLIVQIKQVLRGLIKKYNDMGLLVGENVTLRLSDRSKHASIGFVYSQGLRVLIDQIIFDSKFDINTFKVDENAKVN